MKVKSGFMLRDIAGSKLVVPVGKRTLDFNGMINLNDTGAFLWQRMEKETDEERLVAAILENYADVDEATAREAVRSFTATLRSAGLLDE